MPYNWKEFEQLVARIEQTLSPAGAVVKTNDRIPSKFTGRKREVDVSIRFKVGTTPILITIECRKRKDKQDVTWIEQLVTKKMHLGAARTIAVTSVGLSQEAIKIAKMHDILVRQLSEINKKDIDEWIKIKTVKTIFHHSIIFGTIGIFFYETELNITAKNHLGKPKIIPSLQSMLDKDGINARIFTLSSVNREFSLSEIFDSALTRDKNTFIETPRDGTSLKQSIRMEFPRGTFSTLTTHGRLDVSEFRVTAEFRAVEVSQDVEDQGFEYADEDGSSIIGIESNVEYLGNKVTTSFVKEKDTDHLHISISAYPLDEN